VKKTTWIVALVLLGCGLLASGCTLRAKEHPSEMSYSLPTTINVGIGETVPGTDIRFERSTEDGAYVRIKGQEALKRSGDSLNWKGEPLPGVDLTLKLRVAWQNEDAMQLVGTAKIEMSEVAPRIATISKDSELKFTGPVAYSLGKGAVIPGTTLTYEGRDDEDGAELGGLDEYPFRQVGDSIYWQGKLRDDINIRLELRVLQFDDRTLRAGGLVTLWLGNS